MATRLPANGRWGGHSHSRRPWARRSPSHPVSRATLPPVSASPWTKCSPTTWPASRRRFAVAGRDGATDAPVPPWPLPAKRDRALALADALERSGVRAWIDRASIAGGANWGREIVEGIKGCAALLIL